MQEVCTVCNGELEAVDAVLCDPCELFVHRFNCSKDVIISHADVDDYGNFGLVIKTFCNDCYDE